MNRTECKTKLRWRRGVMVSVAGVLGVTGVAGCGSSSSASGGNAITIDGYTNGQSMGYRVSGRLRPGYATITFKDTATKDLHMMATTRLKPGVTLGQVKAALPNGNQALAALAADDPNTTTYGVPSLVSAGQSVTTNSVNLRSGTYAILCFVPDENGMPHAAMGMASTFTVAGTPYTKAPSSKGTITIADHRFVMPAGFDGHGTYKVSDTGTANHNIEFARLTSGTTITGYFTHVNDAFMKNKPPNGGGGTLVGGIDDLSAGQSAYLTLDLPAGRYGYVSTDGGNGPNSPPDATAGLSGDLTLP